MYNVIIFTDTTDNIMNPIPLGAYKVANAIRLSGYSCLVISHLSDWTLAELQNLLDSTVNSDTFLIGFSSTFLRNTQIERDSTKPTPPYPEIGIGTIFPQGKEFENQVIDYIKNKNSKIKFMVGGARVSYDYYNKNINYVFIGYSETAVVNLADHLTKNIKLNHSIKNIYGITIVDDRLAKGYDFVNTNMTWLATDVVNHKVLPLEIGRGCVFRCKFCDYPMNGKKQLDYVKHPDLLIQELEYNYKNYGIKHYYIVDDTFNDNPLKLKLIRDAVKRLSFEPIFWAYHRLDLICTHPETLEILYDIGIRAMFFGIETLDEKSGRIIGKGYNRQKQIDMINHIKNTYPDITLHGSFIIGLPEETLDSVHQTFNLLINKQIPLDSWMWYGLKIFDTNKITFNSELSKNMVKYGYADLGSDPASIFVNWGSKYTNDSEASTLAKEFMNQGRSTGIIKLTGEASLYLSSMNYSNYEQLTQTPFKDVEWNYIEYNVRPAFVADYKKQILEMIK